jgi:hypothetical protein
VLCRKRVSARGLQPIPPGQWVNVAEPRIATGGSAPAPYRLDPVEVAS